MTAPATYNDSIGYVVNGEQVEAGIANRTAQQLKQNTDYLKNALDALTTKDYVLATNRTVRSDVTVGMPVYYNSVTVQYEPAQAVTGKEAVVGVINAKASTTVADILLAGVGTINITSVLQSGDTLSAGRYYLSETQAGKLTKTIPTHSSGTPAIQASVLIADGLGKVYVLPYQFFQGSTGPQGAIGPQGPIGPQGSSGQWDGYRFAGLATPFDRWYRSANLIAGSVVTYTPAGGAAYIVALPFIAPRGGTLDRLAINITGAAGGGTTTRLGIYQASSQTNPYPTSLLIDAGTVTVDTTGHKTITINQALVSGNLYWFVILFDATVPTAMAGNSGTGCVGVLGFPASTLTVGTAEAYAVSHAQAFAALPATFPSASPTFITQGTNTPLVACRYSS